MLRVPLELGNDESPLYVASITWLPMPALVYVTVQFARPADNATASQPGIVALSCHYEDVDDPQLAAMSAVGVRFSNGATRPTYDVILHHSPSMRSRSSTNGQ